MDENLLDHFSCSCRKLKKSRVLWIVRFQDDSATFTRHVASPMWIVPCTANGIRGLRHAPNIKRGCTDRKRIPKRGPCQHPNPCPEHMRCKCPERPLIENATVVPGQSPFDRRTGIVWAARPRLPCCPDKWVHQLVGRLEAEARTVCFLYSSSKPQVAAERRAFRQTLLAQARRLLQHKHL
jgi:hypothetical protein